MNGDLWVDLPLCFLRLMNMQPGGKDFFNIGLDTGGKARNPLSSQHGSIEITVSGNVVEHYGNGGNHLIRVAHRLITTRVEQRVDILNQRFKYIAQQLVLVSIVEVERCTIQCRTICQVLNSEIIKPFSGTSSMKASRSKRRVRRILGSVFSGAFAMIGSFS